MKNIILCGFMGCGKSTVGKELSKILNTTFVDMDSYIENKAKMTVAEIFEKYGEGGFRDMEYQACLELSETNNKVIAAGGGTLTFERNVNVLKQNGVIVLIDCSYEVLCQRLANDTARPLLQCENRNDKIKELLTKRMPIYKSACDLTVNGDFLPLEVAQNIATMV